MANSWAKAAMLTATMLGAVALVGCGRNGAAGPGSAKSAKAADDALCSTAENWCGEHGIPEDICAQCNANLTAEYKRKGDWCKEHNRPESQCFVCNPKRAEKFARDYEIKYGKKPPKPEGT